jgi:glycosyltransferase involved in cell wall biosynthesis
VTLVSVVVTTRNSAATLADCLRSVREQTHEPVELIVVDNASTDATPAIAREHADLVLDHGPERSAQRNLGVERAGGEYVLIVDSDMTLPPPVVAECVEVATRAQATAIVVPEISVGEGLWSRARALERRCYEGDETIEAARFFRRATFLEHGGYDTGITGPEDWDLPARMRGRETFGRSTTPIVHHEGRLSLVGLARKKYYYGRGFGRYIARHPELAKRQLKIVRPAFLRRRRELGREPALAAAMLFMKAVEFGSGAAGLVSARLGRR